MNPAIPYPCILRKVIGSQYPVQLPPGNEFTNAVYSIWGKFNAPGGINLSGFRHNCRPDYDENLPMTAWELTQVRGYLSDPQLQIVVSPANPCFRWDYDRGSAYNKKIIYIDELFLYLFTGNQSESQLNALRIIFMATLLHCLGDYITSWAQPEIDFNPDLSTPRIEGGTKTEYAFFGGVMGGVQNDPFHYDYAKIRLVNAVGQSDHYLIPDGMARDYYQSDVIHRFNEAGLQRNNLITGPTNTIRQLEICCGHHRLNWKPPAPPTANPPPHPPYFPPGYGQPQQPQQQPFYPANLFGQQPYQQPQNPNPPAPGVAFNPPFQFPFAQGPAGGYGPNPAYGSNVYFAAPPALGILLLGIGV
jgi:hypothetical protein